MRPSTEPILGARTLAQTQRENSKTGTVEGKPRADKRIHAASTQTSVEPEPICTSRLRLRMPILARCPTGLPSTLNMQTCMFFECPNHGMHVSRQMLLLCTSSQQRRDNTNSLMACEMLLKSAAHSANKLRQGFFFFSPPPEFVVELVLYEAAPHFTLRLKKSSFQKAYR